MLQFDGALACHGTLPTARIPPLSADAGPRTDHRLGQRPQSLLQLLLSRVLLGITSLCPIGTTKVPDKFVEHSEPNIVAATCRSKQTSIVFIGAYFDTRSQAARVNQLKKIGCFVSQPAAPYILGADFNMTPKELISTGFLKSSKDRCWKYRKQHLLALQAPEECWTTT